MNTTRRLICILLGPTILMVSIFTLSDFLTRPGAEAVGVLLWMVFWWVTRPVHMTVTAFVPVLVNALLNTVPMASLTAQYASDSIILILGSSLLTLPWAATGLDRRVALKILSIIGPSMRSQITVWLFASMLVSSILPNVAVCALYTPIAVSMLAAAGIEDIEKSEHAVPILLAIGWGVGLGGVGTPLGGAMNIAAISFLEEYTGHEFMYVDWIVRIAPYFVLLAILSLIGMLLLYGKSSPLKGTKEYFVSSYSKLGPMKRDEKICAGLFLIALTGAFTRPLYADLLPGLAPAYIFLLFGSLSFVINAANKKPMLVWETAQQGVNVGHDAAVWWRLGAWSVSKRFRRRCSNCRYCRRYVLRRGTYDHCCFYSFCTCHLGVDEFNSCFSCEYPDYDWLCCENGTKSDSLLVYHGDGL